MAVTSRSVSIIALLVLPLSLAACGGDPAPSAPTAPAASSAAAAPSTSAPTGDDSADKPSREEVKAGYIKAVGPGLKSSKQAFTEAEVKQMANCVVDQMYDKVSPETLSVLVSGDTNRQMPDLEIFKTANISCGTKVGQARAATAAPSAAGGVIKGGVSEKLPASIGAWKAKMLSDTITSYNKGDSSVTISFLRGSDYDAIVENVKKKPTKAGSGVCGEGSTPDNLLCYLETDDGVLSLSTSPDYASLPVLVGFANELTKTLGTK